MREVASSRRKPLNSLPSKSATTDAEVSLQYMMMMVTMMMTMMIAMMIMIAMMMMTIVHLGQRSHYNAYLVCSGQ